MIDTKLITYEQWLDSCHEAGLPAMSKDACARLLAIVGVIGGNNEVFTHNSKLVAEWRYAQKRFNIQGGEIPNAEGVELIKKYYHELEDYYSNAPRNEKSESPYSVIHLNWVTDFMKQRYGIERF